MVDHLVVLDLGQSLCIDGLCGILLLHNSKDTVVQMLVEVLGIGEGLRTRGTLSSGIGSIASEFLSSGHAGWRLLAAVRGSLFNTMNSGQVSLEYICSVERLFGRRPRARAEAANHGALVVGQCVAVLVVFAGKTLDVVFAGLDGTLLGSLILVSEHVRLEVLEYLAAIGIGAPLLLLGFIAAKVGRANWGNEVGHAHTAAIGIDGGTVWAVGGVVGTKGAIVEEWRGAVGSSHVGLR